MNSIAALQNRISKYLVDFQKSNFEEVLLLHHNDTDGLTAGAILNRAFQLEGLKVRRYSLEKPYPIVLESLFTEAPIGDGQLVVLADFGSGMLDKLAQYNKGRFKILVLDHHSVLGSETPGLDIINPLQCGLVGDDCSASALSYQFVKMMNEWNGDLGYLGLLGALGDGFVKNGELSQVNNLAFLDAELCQQVERKGGDYFFLGDVALGAKDLCSQIDTLGSIGYFRGGADIAVKGLLARDYLGIKELADPYQKELSSKLLAFERGLSLNESRNIQWFILNQEFECYGVKTVGLVCQYLRDRELVDPTKYIAGFQRIPDEVPGLGMFKQEAYKVSMRVPAQLQEKIKSNSVPPLTVLLPRATEQCGGFVDAFHPFAAATTIPFGTEERLINEMEKILT